MSDFLTKAAWAFAQMLGTSVVLRLSDNGFDEIAVWIHAHTGLPVGWFL